MVWKARFLYSALPPACRLEKQLSELRLMNDHARSIGYVTPDLYIELDDAIEVAERDSAALTSLILDVDRGSHPRNDEILACVAKLQWWATRLRERALEAYDEDELRRTCRRRIQKKGGAIETDLEKIKRALRDNRWALLELLPSAREALVALFFIFRR